MVEVYHTGSLLVMPCGGHPSQHRRESFEDPEVLLPLAAFQTSRQPFFQSGVHLAFPGGLGQGLGLVTGVELLHHLRRMSQLWVFGTGGRTAARALMKVHGEEVDEASGAGLAAVGPVARAVHPPVEFEVDVLGEFHPAQLALIGLFAGVQTQVGLQVTCAAEAFVTHLRRIKREDCVF